MKPGTKPKPSHLKLIEGNRGKRPLSRKEAKTTALPDPPPYLAAVALEEWHRVASWLHKIGLLSEVDRAALAAQAYGRRPRGRAHLGREFTQGDEKLNLPPLCPRKAKSARTQRGSSHLRPQRRR